MFSASTTYEKQLRIEKTRLSHQVWSHGGSTFKNKRTLNGHFSRPAETDPYAELIDDRRQDTTEGLVDIVHLGASTKLHYISLLDGG